MGDNHIIENWWNAKKKSGKKLHRWYSSGVHENDHIPRVRYHGCSSPPNKPCRGAPLEKERKDPQVRCSSGVFQYRSFVMVLLASPLMPVIMRDRPWAEQQIWSMRSSLTAPPRSFDLEISTPLMPISLRPPDWVTAGLGEGEMGSSSLSIITKISTLSSSTKSRSDCPIVEFLRRSENRELK